MVRVLLTIAFLFGVFTSYAQRSLSDIRVGNIDQSVPLAEFLADIEKKHPVRFFFDAQWFEYHAVDSKFSGQRLNTILDALTNGTDIRYTYLFDYAVIFSKDPGVAQHRDSLLENAFAARKHIDTLTIGDRKRDFVPGKMVTIRGSVESEADGKKMQGVTVWLSDLNMVTRTDAAGNYSMTFPSGEHVLQFQHLNFSDKVYDLRVYKNGGINVVLEEAPTILSEVEVSDQAITTSRVSQSTLRVKDLKRAPTFLGEVDVIKNLQIQSGVTTVGEVAGGFNVRGGGVDQNLVLYDGIPVFNTSHAFGFFTAFNADAISNVSFYRGGIPAEYGGRVSSVLNISSREGGYRKWEGGGGIGIISSHVTLGGPIKKDTTSVIASFRSSYSNWMLNTIKSTYQDIRNSGVSFYDGSAKLTHKFSSRTKLTLSGYTSHDAFNLADDTVYGWDNRAASIRLDHTHNHRLFSSYTLSYGNYSYQLKEQDPETASTLRYSVLYPSLKADFNYNGPHALSFGFHQTYYDFEPGTLNPQGSSSTIPAVNIRNEKSLETALYFSDAFYWKDNFFIELGLRYSLFNRIGPATVYHYAAGRSREPHNIVDSTVYRAGQVVKTYHGAEPRASLRYSLTANASVKLGYNRMYQYLHLITNTAAVNPTDVWQSSNSFFKPQIADQLSLGYYRNFDENKYEFFTEAFYKHIRNVLDFKDGADLILNPRLETALISGIGKAYGVEFSLARVRGRLQGFVNYTLSRSLRKVDGPSNAEQINRGAWYAANYDQPHVANLSWRYGISRRHFFSGNFTYHTGRPMSVPRSGYLVDGIPVADFSDRNTYRIPDYHRLDIAFIIEGNHKLKKLWDGTWVISAYNVYARRNAYSVFYRDDGSGNLAPYKLSIIGTIVPSLTYSFKF